jgi:mRNA-decapping enzyme subunit 2
MIEDIGSAYGQVPVYGAILVNERKTKALCISFRGKLSFPKGKIDELETGVTCAIRECWEETGIDISDKISEKSKI